MNHYGSYYGEATQTTEEGFNYSSSTIMVAAGPINSQRNASTMIDSTYNLYQEYNFCKVSPSSSTTASSAFSEAGPYNFKEKSASPSSSTTPDETLYDWLPFKTVPSKMAHRKFREPLRLRRNQKEMLFVKVPSCEERTKTVMVEMELLRQELDRKQSIKEKESQACIFPKNIRVVPVARNVKELKLTLQ